MMQNIVINNIKYLTSDWKINKNVHNMGFFKMDTKRNYWKKQQNIILDLESWTTLFFLLQSEK